MNAEATPVADVRVSSPFPHSASIATSDARRARVLIVDDVCDAADCLALLLRLRGCDTRVAYDGVNAVEIANEFRPDAIVLDIALPKLDGYEVARRVRREPWGTDVVLVALTGWGRDSDRVRALEAGFNHHFLKPVDPSSIAATWQQGSSGLLAM